MWKNLETPKMERVTGFLTVDAHPKIVERYKIFAVPENFTSLLLESILEYSLSLIQTIA